MEPNISNVMWLAKRQMLDIWPAYIYTGLYFLVMGAAFAGDNGWGADIALPILMTILIQPVISTRYMSWKADNDVARHQSFLHSMPVDVRTIVLARLVGLLAAGLITIPAFFPVFWYREHAWMSFSHFLAWVVFWSGLALIGTAGALVAEFSVSLLSWSKLNMASAAVFIGLLILLIVFADLRVYRASIRFAGDHPTWAVLTGLILGVAALVAGVVLAERGFRRREFEV